MEKVLGLLEKYVEWIAIAIGGLIFMYALWIFWISPDIMAEVNNEEVGPRTVDKAVLRGPGESLEAAMNRPLIGGPGRWQPPEILPEVMAEYRIDPYSPGNLNIPALFAGATLPVRPGEVEKIDFTVNRAPTPPPAEVTRLASGRSFADVPGGNQVAARDLAEVRVDFSISSLAIAQSFRQVLLPAIHQNTSVLRIVLQRQRLRGDGSWGEDYEVPLLTNSPLATMPLPPENAALDAKQAYVAFAESNASWVMQPPFYEVRAGDNPMALQNVVNVEEEGAAPAGQPQTNPAGGGAAQGATNYGAQGDPRAPEAPGGAAPQQRPNPQQPQRPQQGAQGGADQAGATSATPGIFNTSRLQTPLRGWAWDTEAVPGEAYRYRVVYALKNPLFSTKGIAPPDKPQLESLLAIFSSPEATEWSPPITVEPLTYFFMTASSTAQAKFQVFRWQNGGWQTSEFEVTPGDYVGGQQSDGIDYRTGRTLVDVREDPATKETYALLVDDEGRFMRRSVKDTNDPKFKELQQEVKNSGGDGVAAR
jgi:hypothetical protein